MLYTHIFFSVAIAFNLYFVFFRDWNIFTPFNVAVTVVAVFMWFSAWRLEKRIKRLEQRMRDLGKEVEYIEKDTEFLKKWGRIGLRGNSRKV